MKESLVLFAQVEQLPKSFWAAISMQNIDLMLDSIRPMMRDRRTIVTRDVRSPTLAQASPFRYAIIVPSIETPVLIKPNNVST